MPARILTTTGGLLGDHGSLRNRGSGNHGGLPLRRWWRLPAKSMFENKIRIEIGNELPQFYPGVDIDAFQIMPNHFHGIIILVGATPRGSPVVAGAQDSAPTTPIVGAGPRACPITRACPPPDTGQPRGVAPTTGTVVWERVHDKKQGVGLSLPDVVHRFKTMTTKRYTDGVKQSGWPSFPGKLWQRNYYERVVRDPDEMLQIQQYVLDNPQRWEFDRENPQCLVLDTPPPGD